MIWECTQIHYMNVNAKWQVEFQTEWSLKGQSMRMFTGEGAWGMNRQTDGVKALLALIPFLLLLLLRFPFAHLHFG